jgi:hypothetical protein
MTGADLVFACAETIVCDQIRAAVACTGGDADQTLGEVRRWADDCPDRQCLLIQSVRHRVPVLDEMFDGVLELVGGDEDATDVILTECLKSPLLRDGLDRQLAELAGEALERWVSAICAAWREERT